MREKEKGVRSPRGGGRSADHGKVRQILSCRGWGLRPCHWRRFLLRPNAISPKKLCSQLAQIRFTLNSGAEGVGSPTRGRTEHPAVGKTLISGQLTFILARWDRTLDSREKRQGFPTSFGGRTRGLATIVVPAGAAGNLGREKSTLLGGTGSGGIGEACSEFRPVFLPLRPAPPRLEKGSGPVLRLPQRSKATAKDRLWKRKTTRSTGPGHPGHPSAGTDPRTVLIETIPPTSVRDGGGRSLTSWRDHKGRRAENGGPLGLPCPHDQERVRNPGAPGKKFRGLGPRRATRCHGTPVHGARIHGELLSPDVPQGGVRRTRDGREGGLHPSRGETPRLETDVVAMPKVPWKDKTVSRADAFDGSWGGPPGPGLAAFFAARCLGTLTAGEPRPQPLTGSGGRGQVFPPGGDLLAGVRQDPGHPNPRRRGLTQQHQRRPAVPHPPGSAGTGPWAILSNMMEDAGDGRGGIPGSQVSAWNPQQRPAGTTASW